MTRATPTPTTAGVRPIFDQVMQAEPHIYDVKSHAIILNDVIEGAGPIDPAKRNAMGGIAARLLDSAERLNVWYAVLFDLAAAGKSTRAPAANPSSDLESLSIAELIAIHQAYTAGVDAMTHVINMPKVTPNAERLINARIMELDEHADAVAGEIEGREPKTAAEWEAWGRFTVGRMVDSPQWLEAQEAIAHVRHGIVDATA